MARYKSEALYRRYRRRPRPVPHYLLGWLPRWARLAARVPRLVNAPLRRPAAGPAAAAGRRHGPARSNPAAFAAPPFHRTVRTAAGGARGGHRVLLWVDSFGDAFAPTVPAAAWPCWPKPGTRCCCPTARPAAG